MMRRAPVPAVSPLAPAAASAAAPIPLLSSAVSRAVLPLPALTVAP